MQGAAAAACSSHCTALAAAFRHLLAAGSRAGSRLIASPFAGWATRARTAYATAALGGRNAGGGAVATAGPERKKKESGRSAMQVGSRPYQGRKDSGRFALCAH